MNMNGTLKTKNRCIKNSRFLVPAIFFVVLVFSGCETTSHEQEGQVIGGLLGGVLGAQVGDGRGRTAAIILGALAGSMIGQHMGKNMDDGDRSKSAMALSDNRSGEATSWINPDTGNEFVFTPKNTFEKNSGPCREFQLNAVVGGKPDQDVFGTACLQSDGSWLVQ